MQVKLSHAHRQLQAMAAQVREAGLSPIFVKNPKGGTKGNKNNRSRSPGNSSKTSDAGSVKSENSGRKGRGKNSGKPKAKAKGKAKAGSSGDAKDISEVVCYNCGDKGHYSNKCTKPKKARGSPGSTPPGSSKSSSASSSSGRSSSNGSQDSGTGPIDRVCHFHKPWRKKEQGGPKKCTSGDSCRFIHAESEKAYKAKEAETGRKKKQPSRGQVARMPGLFLTAALLAAIPGQTESLQLPRYPQAGLEASGLGSCSRPSWANEVSGLGSCSRTSWADEFTRSCTAVTDASFPWIHYADSCLP